MHRSGVRLLGRMDEMERVLDHLLRGSADEDEVVPGGQHRRRRLHGQLRGDAGVLQRGSLLRVGVRHRVFEAVRRRNQDKVRFVFNADIQKLDLSLKKFEIY